ncbi:MAG: ssk1 response regulator receiver [Thelocarpon impressellum]|nr:MAG: ssk1 response regulator receiver [Thelocarpon impressellum]
MPADGRRRSREPSEEARRLGRAEADLHSKHHDDGPDALTQPDRDRELDPLSATHAPTASSASPSSASPPSASHSFSPTASTHRDDTTDLPSSSAAASTLRPGERPAQAQVADVPPASADGTALQLQPLQPRPRRPRLQSRHRQQSLVVSSDPELLGLLDPESPLPCGRAVPPPAGKMATRKIWVKRPGASATLVSIREDELVDDVRDMILKKYANSLGRSFDAPDVTLRIAPREPGQRHGREGERALGPEEPMAHTLDTYFPGGQSVDEALLIDVPHRRTPKPSPRSAHHAPHYADDMRPGDGGDYFPPMPAIPSPQLPSASLSSLGAVQSSHHPSAHSIAVLNTGHVPALPSPGTRGPPRHHGGRPRVGRTLTGSPPVSTSTPNALSSAIKPAPPVPPPLPAASPASEAPRRAGTPPPARVASPRPRQQRKARKGNNVEQAHVPDGLLDGAVPPINVLIVEDNIINLKLLEAFMKRVKVRWQSAMNGKEAVSKWRAGGFHLVLMDIQLPVMNGLEATKEIRRLERLNSIGVFSSTGSSTTPETAPQPEPEGEDKLTNTVLFKSPVIIVALTASSLQSDRHEALAAGCNDFLTKPVNIVWLESKVMEWGCMQALIDFDGWRKWKDFSQSRDERNAKAAAVGRAKRLQARSSAPGTAAAPSGADTAEVIAAGA